MIGQRDCGCERPEPRYGLDVSWRTGTIESRRSCARCGWEQKRYWLPWWDVPQDVDESKIRDAVVHAGAFDFVVFDDTPYVGVTGEACSDTAGEWDLALCERITAAIDGLCGVTRRLRIDPVWGYDTSVAPHSHGYERRLSVVPSVPSCE